ncbi:MAG: hypothetical protein KIS66_15935 [Fimbriimonadaceae bacterium]|nr:hypothetical protein [Fimbriimonadaceae bacterium]
MKQGKHGLGWIIALAVGTIAALAAGQARTYPITDKAGNMALRDVRSHRYEDHGDGTITFIVMGSPVLGEWKAQRMKSRAEEMTILANRGAKGALDLVQADVTGKSAEFTVERDSDGEDKKVAQTMRLISPHLRYLVAQERVTLDAPVKAEGSDPGAKRRWNLEGRSGVASLYPAEPKRADSFPLRAMTLEGPVTFSLNSVRKVKRTKDGTTTETEEPTLYKGKANRLVFDDATKTIVLTGNVTLETDEYELAGGEGAERAVLKLDAKRQVVGVEMNGAPGVSTIRKPKGGR